MGYEVLEDFERELNSLKDRLPESRRRKARTPVCRDDSWGKLKVDIELPYSSFPKRRVEPWAN